MELVSIEFSQLTWLGRLYRKTGGSYVPDVVSALQARYSFVQVPAAQNLIHAQQLDLEGGKFLDHAIDKVSVYRDGVVISSRVNTRFIDQFLGDALEFLKSEFFLEKQEFPESQLRYDSRVVVQGNFEPEKWLSPAFLAVRDGLAEMTTSYGISGADFQAAGFVLQSNSTAIQGLPLTSFSFDRRVGLPFEQKLFFSIAPLRTDDHLELLARLESD